MTQKRILAGRNKDIARFVQQARRVGGENPPARVIFALDATASREPTWDTACHVQNEMFAIVGRDSGLAVQLLFYRGFGECRSSKWVSDANALIGLMRAVRCQAGQTQIRRVLRHGIREAEHHRVHAIVFVGDAVEEEVDDLAMIAGQLALKGTKLFLFQEGNNPLATRAFRHLAKASRGVHCQFDSAAPDQLRDLLAAVAAYADGGAVALGRLAAGREGVVRLIEKQLS